MGLRVKIEYYDQNEEFSSILPRLGTVTREVKAKGNDDMWLVVSLDEPFEYRTYNGAAVQLNAFKCRRVLIRSRWMDEEIGTADPVSVFIMLAFDDEDLDSEEIDVQRCHLAAWGLCSRIDEVAA